MRANTVHNYLLNFAISLFCIKLWEFKDCKHLVYMLYFLKLTTVRKMKSDIFKFAENSSHNFKLLVPFIKAGIYDIYVNSVTYIRVKMDSHTNAHIPIIFLMWCSMKLWPLTLQVTNSRPSRTNGFPHCKKKKNEISVAKTSQGKMYTVNT